MDCRSFLLKYFHFNEEQYFPILQQTVPNEQGRQDLLFRRRLSRHRKVQHTVRKKSMECKTEAYNNLLSKMKHQLPGLCIFLM